MTAEQQDERVILDPTLTLRDIRSLSARIEDQEAWALSGNMKMLIASIDGLDAWISEGGYLPDQWRNRRRGRPRRVGDGPVVLEDVVHGKRSSYNSGCRCLRCTAANREAAASWRNQQKNGV